MKSAGSWIGDKSKGGYNKVVEAKLGNKIKGFFARKKGDKIGRSNSEVVESAADLLGDGGDKKLEAIQEAAEGKED